MSDDYGYINARLRAMKGRLLRRSDYEALLEAAGLDEVVSLLDGTPHGPEIEQALTLKKGIAGVEEGLRRSLQKTFDGIVRMASDRPAELLHVVMGRWELLNIKTVLRGRHVGALPESIMANLVPFGRLDDVALGELVRQPAIPDMVSLLAQWRVPYALPLREAVPLYKQKEDLQVLEHALDLAYFSTSLKAVREGEGDDAVVLDFIRKEIDLLLISYALRFAHHGIAETDAATAFIPGGRAVNLAVFERMLAARDPEDLVKAIPVPAYVTCLDKGMFAYLESRRLSALERSMETCFAHAAVAGITRDPLSISVAVAVLWLLVNEIVNLRVVSRGKHTNMPRAEIEKYLVLLG